MAKICVFLADGFEEVEALAPIDILRRGGQQVVTVSIMPGRQVTGAHGVAVEADTLFDDCDDLPAADLLVLPGGMPGAAHLDGHEGVRQALVAQHERGGLIGAICAAPMVLGHLGLLRGRRATCYPGFEGELDGAEYTAAPVEEDGTIVTAEGPGAAMAFGYALLRRFVAGEQVDQLEQGMRYRR